MAHLNQRQAVSRPDGLQISLPDKPTALRRGARVSWSFIAALFLGCVGDGVNATLDIALPDGIPVRAVTLTLFPFDIDALIDSLAAASDFPPPDLSELEEEIRRVRPTPPLGVEALEQEWADARRNVAHLADSLAGADRATPSYSAAYARLRTLYADLTAREFALERRLREIMSTDQATIAARARDGSDSLRRWEAEALSGLSDAVLAKINETGREPITLGDLSDTRIRQSLPPGSWWAVIRLPHPESPFLEYYWSVPFTTNRLIPVIVPIGTSQASVRWRH